MIITKLLGGLGNQLFQYAVGRALAYKLDVPLKIHKYDFNLYSLRPFALGALNISATDASNDDVARVMQQHPNSGEESERRFLPEILDSPDNTYLRGDWQCEDYFKDIADVIRNEFSLKKPFSEDAKKWEKKIITTKNSVSIHVRRGDYVKNPSVRKNFGVLPASYYQSAIDELKKYGDDFKAFVFSDDIEWVKKNLCLDFPTEYIQGVKFDYEELALMSLCKNHIIANSSFGWWGAWLDPNPNKIVIAPNPWFRASVANADIVPSTWITLPSFLRVTEPEKPSDPVISAVLNITNDANYTRIAIQSLIDQKTFDDDDLEIIAIANASTEDALEAAKNLLKDRENARIIETERIPPGAAYNMGLAAANGKYVTFIGGRDCLSPTAFFESFNSAENCATDVLHPICWYAPDENGDKEFFGRRFKTFADDETNSTVLLVENTMLRMEFLGIGGMNHSITGKLFKKDFLIKNEITFNETLTHGEDIDFILCVLGLRARYITSPIAARISLGTPPHDKQNFVDEFRAFIIAINSHFNKNISQTLRDRITGLMAMLYLDDHLRPIFSDEDYEDVKNAIMSEFGVSISAEKNAENSTDDVVDTAGWEKIAELSDGVNFDEADDNVNYYSTLFDSNYLTRGLAMYRSLVESGEKFRLFVFAFDNFARDILRELNLPYMKVISLKEFETEELLAVKKTRTRQEYCWTCTSFSIWHCLEHFDIKEVTYLDSDLFFYHSPRVVIEEFHNAQKDVLITRHNYTPKYDQSETSGVYCVQFMTFKNNENGRKVLKWWKDACGEWCYARVEPGRFGDQKYLDDWTERFEGVHVMQNKAAGLAPWNIQQYDCKSKAVVNGKDAIFYHFHGLKWYRGRDSENFNPGAYDISQGAWDNLYQPYIKALKESLEFVRERYDNNFIKGILWSEYNIW